MVLFISVHSGHAQKYDKVIDENIIDYSNNKPERIAWFNTLGMGMFIHFGVDAPLGIVISHSLVGASEDYLQRYFNELPHYFNPYNFKPREIARLAKLAGMKYIMLTAKHHSGFCLWDTKTTDFNVMNTPYHKDLLREYIDAVRAEGLGVGLYFSPEDFHFLYEHHQPINRFFDNWTPELRKQFDALNQKQCAELMQRYGKIDLLFIDGEPKDIVKKTCWDLQPDIVITRGAMKTPEQVLPGQMLQPPWLSCITIGYSWQYQPTNNNYKTGNQLINLAVDTRSKGGSLLINIGPKPDGSITSEEEGRLREMAGWYFANHESMDTVQSCYVNHEGNTWFTTNKKSNIVYAIITDADKWKEGERQEKIFHSMRANINTRISVLGQNGKDIEYKVMDVAPRFTPMDNGIKISVVKTQRFYDNHGWPNPIVIKLENVTPRFTKIPAVVTFSPKNTIQKILKGKVLDSSVSDKPTVAYFQYRKNEGLYSKQWQKLPFVKIAADGTFQMALPLSLATQKLEIKASIVFHDLEIDGESVFIN